MIDIFRNINDTEEIICSIADDNARIKKAIMGVDEVVIDVTVDSVLDIAIGDHMRIDGIIYELNRDPEFNQKSAVEHQYSFTFEHPLYRLLDKLYINKATQKASFTLTGRLSDFVELLIWNINKTEDNPNGVDTGWTVGSVPVTDYKTLTFGNTLCRDILTKLADDFNVEFFANNKEINFVDHIENETELVFSQGRGKGLYTVSQKNVDTDNAVTRVYPIGGIQNVPAKHADADGHLILPEAYIENFTEYNKIVERVVEFNDIFPSFTGTIASVAGENNNVLKCVDIDFDINKVAVGDEARINFLSGDLMGKSFVFQWSDEKKEITLIEQEDDTALPDESGKRPTIPSALKKVKVSDEFNFTGLNLPETYFSNAIDRLRKAAADWLEFYSRKRIKFELSIDHRYLRGKQTVYPGDLVSIKVPDHNIDKVIRVTSVDKKIKTGELTCVVSNYLDEKWEKKIEGQISSMQTTVGGTGGGLKVDILERNDIRPVKDSNVFSSLRTLAELLKNNEELKKFFVSKTGPDSTDYLLKLLGGAIVKNGLTADSIEVGEFIDSLSSGKGIGIFSNGLIQANSLELRRSLTVLELIFNRLSAQEGDTSFSEYGLIEIVERLEESTYRLPLRKRHETDFTAFDWNDIIYGSVNDLASAGGNYRTSWMRVLGVNTTENYIEVVLYLDSEVPGGKNYPPEPLMSITRRGNTSDEDRQSYWYISSYEKCICMLDGVTKPILEENNYSIIIGRMKRLSLFDNLPINYRQSYVYCRGLIRQDDIRVDVTGKPIYDMVDRGVWQSGERYYFEAKNETTGTNETSTVYHRGSKWQCIKTGTLFEPRWNSTDWAFLEGNGEFSIDFESSKGFSFFYGLIDTVIEAKFFHGRVDVTDDVMTVPGTVITWKRDTGIPAEDKSWSPVFVDEQKNKIHLISNDMGSQWLNARNVTFKIDAIIPLGEETYLRESEELQFNL